MADKRPDPDQLLAHVQKTEERAGRGRLKIYLGMSAGVGKTYAMLSDALVLRNRGDDVVAGYIEPHGRTDTEALATQLEIIPVKRIEHKGIELVEFDLDAALKRKPTVLLVDELAHTNAPGSRHTKRWQDIADLLESGISVYSTVNVQHLESLSDVVTRITGAAVQETVPDAFISRADQIELIDIPPEDLIQRLKEGKIYAPEKVETALRHFFKAGNLMALRELVLRQVADRVDAEMRHYRHEHAVDAVWPTAQRIVVCVAPNALSSRVVREAGRLASTLKGELIAVSVENARYASLAEDQRRHMTKALRVAEDLGAEVVIREGENVVETILEFARERNATAIVTGKPYRKRWRDWLCGSIVDELIQKGGDISVHVIPGMPTESRRRATFPPVKRISSKGMFFATAVTAISTAICTIIYPYFDLSNLIMVYLLGVAWVSAREGQSEAALAAVLGVLAFDFCFVPPRFTFAVSDVQYFVTFVVMLVVALLISTLTQRLKAQATVVKERERRTAALYGVSRELASTRTREEVAAVAVKQLDVLLKCDGAVLVSGESQTALVIIAASVSGFESEPNEMAVAQWVNERRRQAGAGTDTLSGAKGRYIPLDFSQKFLGVLALKIERTEFSLRERDLLEAFASQIAHAMYRVHLESEARKAHVEMEGEKLRNALLSSISHDLRTPLASIAGAASALAEQQAFDQETRRDLAVTIYEESERLGRILRNVLDMTKLESGVVTLQLEWHALEELIGSALRRVQSICGNRKVTVTIPEDLPLIRADGLLLEQVFVNLLENAAKYTPKNTPIRIAARIENGSLVCDISDSGPGLPSGDEVRIFEKLYRASKRGEQGFGLGLAICRAIAEAHSGTITALILPEGGAQFTIRLPLIETAPEVIHG